MVSQFKSPETVINELAYQYKVDTYYGKFKSALDHIASNPQTWGVEQHKAWKDAATEFLTNVSNLRQQYRVIASQEPPEIPLLKGWT